MERIIQLCVSVLQAPLGFQQPSAFTPALMEEISDGSEYETEPIVMGRRNSSRVHKDEAHERY